MRRVKLSFTQDFEVEFTDREKALKQVYEFAEKGTAYPIVVYGPEGCGKTAWLKQSAEVLKDLGYGVIYFNPLRREFLVEVGVRSVEERVQELLKQASSEFGLAKLIWSVIDFARDTIRLGRGRVAVLVDDAFQFTTTYNAALFVKGLLELIEHPVERYERIVAIAATSEGFSRREVGRHRWAEIRAMWNMSKEGFKELYDKLPEPKSDFENVWRLSGGNPDILRKLYRVRWDVNSVLSTIIEDKGITPNFINKWRSWLEKAVEDPDNLWSPEVPEELIDELMRKNLIIYNMHSRFEFRWVDEPPPEKDLELGIGRYVAWQTPIYREAVKKVLKK